MAAARETAPRVERLGEWFCRIALEVPATIAGLARSVGACCCSRRGAGLAPELDEESIPLVAARLVPLTDAAPGCLESFRSRSSDIAGSIVDYAKESWALLLSSLTTSVPYLAIPAYLFLRIFQMAPETWLGSENHGVVAGGAIATAVLILVGTYATQNAVRTNVKYDTPELPGFLERMRDILTDPDLSLAKKIGLMAVLIVYFPTFAFIPNVAYYAAAEIAIKAIVDALAPTVFASAAAKTAEVLSGLNFAYTFIISIVYLNGSMGFAAKLHEIFADAMLKIRKKCATPRRAGYTEVLDVGVRSPSSRTTAVQTLNLVFSLVCAIGLAYSFVKDIQECADPENPVLKDSPFGWWARLLKADNIGLAYLYLISFITATSYYGSKGLEYIGAMVAVMRDKDDPRAADARAAFWKAFFAVGVSTVTILGSTVAGGIGLKEAYIYLAIILFTYCNNGKAWFPSEAKNPALSSNKAIKNDLHLEILRRLLKEDYIGIGEWVTAIKEAGVEEKELWQLAPARMLQALGEKDAKVLLKPAAIKPKAWSEIWTELWEKIVVGRQAALPAIAELITNPGLSVENRCLLANFYYKPMSLSQECWDKIWPEVNSRRLAPGEGETMIGVIQEILQRPSTWTSMFGKKAAQQLLKPASMDAKVWDRVFTDFWKLLERQAGIAGATMTGFYTELNVKNPAFTGLPIILQNPAPLEVVSATAPAIPSGLATGGAGVGEGGSVNPDASKGIIVPAGTLATSEYHAAVDDLMRRVREKLGGGGVFSVASAIGGGGAGVRAGTGDPVPPAPTGAPALEATA